MAAKIKKGDRVIVTTGRDKGKARDATLARLASGELTLIVGTHALMQEDVAAANPAMEAMRLPIGAELLLPPKLAPPEDAKEMLAWAFFGRDGRWGKLRLRRVYPDEVLGAEFDEPYFVGPGAPRAAWVGFRIEL